MSTAGVQYRQTVGGSTFMGREVGKCRKCKTVVARVTMFWGGSQVTCECGSKVKLQGVWGSESTKDCDARCISATGPNCECSCGGENHGGIHF